MRFLLLFVAATLAGAINSVAGGGTLLTFPSLLAAGVSPIVANATNTVALVPGSLSAYWGYRSEMGRSRRDLVLFGLPSLAGGVIGAFIVVKAGDQLFSRLVPWLIFSATGLFLLQDRLKTLFAPDTNEGAGTARFSRRHPVGATIFQFLVAIYGGFFGAGMGILMLAAMGMMGMGSIHRMNGLKNFAAVCINGVAAVTFALMHRVNWPFAALMAVGAVAGGYGGAGAAQRIGEKNVRRLVIYIGLGIGFWTLLRHA
jgi:hypothetical protein